MSQATIKKDKNKELFLEQLRKTPVVQAVCEKIGIARWTAYRWKQEDPEFAKAFDEAVNEGRCLVNDVAISQLLNAIKNGNLTAIMFWLKHFDQNFKTRVEIEGALKTVQELSPQQEELMKKAFMLTGLNLNYLNNFNNNEKQYESDNQRSEDKNQNQKPQE